MVVLLCLYGAIAGLCFLFIVYSALFRRDRKDLFVPFFFGSLFKMEGWRSLTLYGSLAALLWLPALCFIVYLIFSQKKR